MRIRFLASVVVAAAALLAPVAAQAAPVLVTPSSSPIVAKTAINFSWSDGASETQFQIVSGDSDGFGGCPAVPANRADASAVLLPTQFSYPLTPLIQGTACYYVEAEDAIPSFSYSDPVLITFDSVPPSGTLNAPTDGALLQGGTNLLSATASDVTTGVSSVIFERSSDGGSNWATIATSSDSGPLYTANWDTGSLASTFLVRASITDGALNTFSTNPVTVTVDNSSPLVTLTSPASAATLHGQANVLSANASDTGTGVSTVTFQSSSDGGTNWNLIDVVSGAGPTYTSNWDTTGLNGTFLVRALVADGASHSANSAVTVKVDNTDPTGSVTAPASGALLHGATNALTATASDASPGAVASVQFEVQQNGSSTWIPVGAPDSSSPYSVNWTTSGLSGGYSVHALIADGAGHVFTTASVPVTVDTAAPVTTVTAPLPGAILHGTVAVDATATDVGGSGVTSVAFQWSVATANAFNTTFTTDNTDNAAAYHGSLVTTGLPDGHYDIRAVATDFATNQGTSSVLANVLVDNTSPPAPGTPTGFATVQSSPSFTFAASTDPGGVNASGVDHYNVYRDNPTNLVGTVVAPSTSFVDTTTPPDGPHTYTVVAVDHAGNSSPASNPFGVVVDSNAQTAPTSLSTPAQWTNQRPQISWVAPVQGGFVHHYEIFRNGTSVGTVLAPTTTFTDQTPNLANNSYAYVVVAESGETPTPLFTGTPSGAVGVVYDTVAPSGPAGVSASAALDGSVSLGWTPSGDGAGSGIAKYVVRRSSSATPPATVADGDATCQVTATSCSDASALNGKLYSYSVFAVDRAGNTSAAGTSPSVTARDQTAPGAPTGLAATPGDGSVSLSWTPAGADDDVAGYALVAKQGTQAPTSDSDGLRVCTTIVGTSSTCDAGGLTNGAVYTFGLFALDEALNRSQPAVVSSTPNGKVDDTVATAAVSKLGVKVVGNKVTLSWKNPADRDFDHVVITSSTVKPSADKAGARVYSGKGTKATIKLAPGQSRWFVVVAYDAVGNASAPASIRAVVKAVSPFGPAPKAKVHGKVRLSWPTVKGARYYNVQIFAGKKRVAVGWPAGHALVVPHAKLHKGVKYTWYVWPGLGAKAKAHYGKLIGKNVFTFTG